MTSSYIFRQRIPYEEPTWLSMTGAISIAVGKQFHPSGEGINNNKYILITMCIRASESVSFNLKSHEIHHLARWALSNKFRCTTICDAPFSSSLRSFTKTSLADVQSPMTDCLFWSKGGYLSIMRLIRTDVFPCLKHGISGRPYPESTTSILIPCWPYYVERKDQPLWGPWLLCSTQIYHIE